MIDRLISRETAVSLAILAVLLVGIALLMWTGTSLGLAVGLFAALLYASLYDIRTLLLPDSITLPLTVIGVLLAMWQAPPLLDRLIGAAAGALILPVLNLIYRAWRGRSGVGLGDAKLLAAAGAWLGWRALPILLLIAAVSGLAMALLQIARGRELRADTALPFGPFLALAFFLLYCWRLPSL